MNLRTIALLLALHTTALFAQPGDSTLRRQYEKEPNGPHGDCPVKWKTLQPGLEYRTIRCLGDTDDLDLHVVRVDLDRWDLDTATVDRGVVSRIARTHRAPFVMNANFFDRNYNPLGAIVRSGDVVQSPRASSWQSIFVVDDDGLPHVIMPSQWKSWKNRVEMAVQAGPRLVIAGHTNKGIRNNYAAPRAGVCIQGDGDLLFFATPKTRKLHISEIARVARRDESDGGLACRDAMLFDGGHSVNFRAEGDDDTITIEQDPVPVFVYATPK